MKHSLQALVSAMLMVCAGGALAESTYGYDPTGASLRTAKADLTVEVTIPKLILLRVGSSGATVDKASITAAFTGGIPGGEATLADGSGLATGWDGTAPTFGDASSAGVVVRAWTNGSGASIGGQIQSGEFAVGGKVQVSNSAPTGGGLDHPGATLGDLGGTVSIPLNTVVGSTWTYGVSGAGLGTTAAGTYTALVRYTATAP